MCYEPYKPLRHRKYIRTEEPEGFSPGNPERFHEVGAVHLYQFTPSMMEWLEELGIFMCREEIAEEIVKHLGLSEDAAFAIVSEFERLPLAGG
jgi:hypothetical protein